MAPEIYFTDNTNVCHKKPLYNNKCDIWSIGVVLHELAYKKHPFGYDFELFRKNQRINLDNPIPAIERIIDRCLVMDSKDRADISELVKMASEYPFEPSKLVEKSSDTLGILENPTIGRLSPKYRPALKIEDSV
jgi:serine/threonine protein kinase